MRTFALVCLVLVSTLANSQDLETGKSRFLRTELAGGISLEVPRDWTFTGADEKRLIETYAESVWDLTKIPHGPSGMLLGITAPENSGYISITVVLEYRSAGTQQEVQRIPKPQLATLDQQNRQDIEAGSSINGLKIISWEGTTVEKVAQYSAIIKRYKYTLPGQAPRNMENCQFFLGNRIVSLLFQTGEKTLVPARPIFERVKSTIVFK